MRYNANPGWSCPACGDTMPFDVKQCGCRGAGRPYKQPERLMTYRQWEQEEENRRLRNMRIEAGLPEDFTH